MAGAKVIMDPVVSEEVSYEENELENAGVFLHVPRKGLWQKRKLYRLILN
jgi:hypothetical protein